MTTKAEILRSIRTHCIECSGGSRSEVAKCVVYTCDLQSYRFGTDPEPSKTRGFKKQPCTHAVSDGKGTRDSPPKVNPGTFGEATGVDISIPIRTTRKENKT